LRSSGRAVTFCRNARQRAWDQALATRPEPEILWRELKSLLVEIELNSDVTRVLAPGSPIPEEEGQPIAYGQVDQESQRNAPTPARCPKGLEDR